ncbi:MAG TPA: DUF6390 family protein [Candidatus Nanoarchaeia archaeon]
MHHGLKVATAYSLPSFSLGFCGPQDKTSRKTLSDYASGKPASEKAVREIFEKFESAYHYYKLIAEKNNIADPLDKRVVKAFWVGNPLLEKVDGNDLRNLILIDFYRPGLLTRKEAEEKAAQVPPEARPHHSFHVLILGAVSDRIKLKGAMLDLCRTGWGKVLKVTSNKLQVKSKSLVLGRNTTLGKETEKEIEWSSKIVPNVKEGDWVSFHWGRACEILTSQEVKNLEYYTQKTIGLVNCSKRP